MPATVSDLPTMGRPDPPAVKPESVKVAAEPEPKRLDLTITTKTIQVPCMSGASGFVRKRVDVRLTRNQGEKLKRILLAMEDREAKLSNGRRVESVAHVLPYILDQIE